MYMRERDCSSLNLCVLIYNCAGLHVHCVLMGPLMSIIKTPLCISKSKFNSKSLCLLE